MSKYSVISADSHIIEPGDLWINYAESMFKDRVPQLEPDPRIPGGQRFTCDGVAWYNPASAVMDPEGGEGPFGAKVRIEDIYPGAYDPDARLKVLVEEGVDAEVIYPTVGLVMFTIRDLELRHACLQAYNNFMADFSAAHPAVLKAVCLVDLSDVEWSAQEMRRCAKIGLRGAMITNETSSLARWASPDLDPIWAAAEELDCPLSLHVAAEEEGNIGLANQSGDRFSEWNRISTLGADRYFPIQRAIAVLIFSGVFQRFPHLKVVGVEAEASWAISVIWQMDERFTRRANRRFIDSYPIASGTMLPSEYWRRNVFVTVLLDQATVAAIPFLGADNIMWSSDYPHPDGSYPGSLEYLDRMLAGASAADRQKIVAGNVERLYGF